MANLSQNHRRLPGLFVALTCTVSLTGLALLLSCAGSAHGQVDTTPESDFLEGLSSRGLAPLISHYVENRAIDDPMVRAMAEIAAARGVIFSPQTPGDQRDAAVEKMIQSYADLFEKNPTHIDRPIWAVEEARVLLERLLPAFNYAGKFVEFGEPTTDQQMRFDRYTAEAWFVLDRGALAWFDIQGRAPRQKDFAALVNAGKWAQLNQLGNIQIPVYRAQAAYLVSFQADDGEYFKRKKAMAEKQGIDFDIAEERKKLLGAALTDVETAWDLAASQVDARTRSDLLALKGRILNRQGKHDGAINALNQSLQLHNAVVNQLGDQVPVQIIESGFFKEVAKATVFGDKGDTSAAVQMLHRLRDHRVFQANPRMSILYLLLLADAESNLYEGDKQFDPYREILADPDLDPRLRGGLEQLIYSRVYRKVDPATIDYAKAPIFTIEAVATQAMKEGNTILRTGGDTTKANEHLTAAKQAQQALLNERKADVSQDELPRYAFNYAATLWSLKDQLNAAKAFIDVADQYPNSKQALQAIPFGYKIVGLFYERNKENEEIRALYEKTLALIIDHFKELDQLYQTAQYDYASYLFKNERYADAVKIYEDIGDEHPFKLPAQYEMTIAYYSLWEDASPTQRAKYLPGLVAAANKYEKIATAALDRGGKSDRDQEELRYRIGNTLLVLASLRADNESGAPEALKLVDRVDREFSEFDDLRKRALIIRIRSLVALGKFEQVIENLERITRDAPRDAGAIIMSVIEAINAEINQQKLLGNEARAKELAKFSKRCADVLLAWFRKNNPDADDLPIVIIRTEADIAAGTYEDAIKELKRLHSQPKYANNADVLRTLGEAHYLQGEAQREAGQIDAARQAHRDARKIYKEIMEATEDEQSDFYWKAVARTYQVSDALSEMAEPRKVPNSSIYLGARQYLERNPTIPRKYKQILERLRNKHTPS